MNHKGVFMMEPPIVQWDGSLEGLFSALDEVCRTGTLPRRMDRPGPPGRAVFSGGMAHGDDCPLFAAPEAPAALDRKEYPGGLFFPAPEGSPPFFPDLRGSPSAALLRELSAAAFDAVIHAWMSELPGAAEIIRFAWKVILAAFQTAARQEPAREGPPGMEPPRRPDPAAESLEIPDAGAFWPDMAQTPRWAALPQARRGAEKAAAHRGDPETCAVLEAAYKAEREINRLMGFLRFSPFPSGGDSLIPGGPVYIARCSPDHYVLPGLADHFSRRFGGCPWAVIDEKRNLALAGEGGGEARIFSLTADQSPASRSPGPDGNAPPDYEELWRNYHRSINNPDRNNPVLQRQFIPRRYRKYLPELW
jgi:probable DNA metabolism protein